MHLLRDSGDSSELKSLCILYAPGFCARSFLAVITMDGMYVGFAGAKPNHEAITIF